MGINKRMKICTFLGCETFKTGVYLVNFGGGIVFPLGMTIKKMFMLAGLNKRCAIKIILAI